MVSLLGERRQRRHVDLVSLEVRVLGDGAVFEGIESAVDGEEEEDLRELGEDRGRHVCYTEDFLVR